MYIAKKNREIYIRDSAIIAFEIGIDERYTEIKKDKWVNEKYIHIILDNGHFYDISKSEVGSKSFNHLIIRLDCIIGNTVND